MVKSPGAGKGNMHAARAHGGAHEDEGAAFFEVYADYDATPRDWFVARRGRSRGVVRSESSPKVRTAVRGAGSIRLSLSSAPR